MDKIVKKLWSKYGTIGILAIIVIIIGVISPQYFLTTKNLSQVALQSTINILIACGEFFTILIGGIDLSVGSMVGLTSMVTGKLLAAGFPIVVSILLGGVLLGVLLGAINGYLVNATGLHPFIITLGTQSIFRGVTMIISDARSVHGFPSEFMNTIAGTLFYIPVPVIIALVIAIILSTMSGKTVFGRNLYALGGNKEAAWFTGINTKTHTILTFIISGLCCGIAGVVMAARLGAAEPSAGTGFETYAIAAAIIGGTSFFGGKGTIFGVVIGGLIIGVISNGLNILNVSTFYQMVVMGLLIIAAVFLDRIFGRKAK